MSSKKVKKKDFPSFRRKPESSYFKTFWTPVGIDSYRASAGVTIEGTFYETINAGTYEFQLTTHNKQLANEANRNL